MAKAYKPQVLTANALLGGESVWWTGARWSDDFAEALAARTEAEAAMFESIAAAPFAGPACRSTRSSWPAPVTWIWRPASSSSRRPRASF